ncbi:MAG: hypothetical protein HUN04_02705 [Desulfobacter sp.]|nr:MAG: hypothetical protein HUN04_02705 [Desulfobacter sp.]
METYVKAGRIIRLFGWLQVLGFIGMTIAIIIPLFAGDNSLPDPVALVPMFSMALIPFLFFKIGSAIKEHKDWGRIVGIILAVVMLFGFPIGTIVGAYILWCLIKGWE